MNISTETVDFLNNIIDEELSKLQVSEDTSSAEEYKNVNTAEKVRETELDEPDDFPMPLDMPDNIVQFSVTKRDGFSKKTKELFNNIVNGGKDKTQEELAEDVKKFAYFSAKDIINPDGNPNFFDSEADRRQPTDIERDAFTMGQDMLHNLYAESADTTKKQILFFQNILRNEKENKCYSKYRRETEEEIRKQENREYSKGAASFGNKTFDITKVFVQPSWADDLSNALGSDCIENIDIFTEFFTAGVLREFGDSRIESIYIVSDSVIVNNVAYRPVLNLDMNSFPADMFSYVKEGCYAYFLDWNLIQRRAKNITVLGFDSMQYVIRKVSADLGLGRRLTKTKLFERFRNMYELTIGNDTITVEDLENDESEDSANVSKKMAKSQRSYELKDSLGVRLLDGWNPNVYSMTDYLQKFTGSSFRNHIENRGDKGLLRFCIGFAVKGVGALAGLTFNGLVHAIGGTFKTVIGSIKEHRDS